MVDPFARMAGRLLQRLGEPALLRGTVETRVSLEHGVAVLGEYGQVAGMRTMATLLASDNPACGDALVAAGKTWRLDALERNDGQFARYSLLEA